MRRVGVIVPVFNEEMLLAGCLNALSQAADAAAASVSLTVVFGTCTDESAAVFAGAELAGFDRVAGIAIECRCVGAARAAGITAVGESAVGEHEWFATTDADSQVPPDWLNRQLAYRDAGFDVVAGTVVVAEWPAGGLRDRYESGYHSGRGHRHVHGANLGFSATSYLAVGGFAPLVAGEDVDLVARLESHGAAVAWAHDLPVITSPRLDGRAPDGFSAHLRGLQEEIDVA